MKNLHKLRGVKKEFCPKVSEGDLVCNTFQTSGFQIPDLTSRSMRQYSSVIFSHQFVAICYGSPGKLTHAPLKKGVLEFRGSDLVVCIRSPGIQGSPRQGPRLAAVTPPQGPPNPAQTQGERGTYLSPHFP